jgi:hypothetical protein|tara:strand:- start:226 stop:441 length:216 start_codon:yes stop_codon:yes gene_type:complete
VTLRSLDFVLHSSLPGIEIILLSGSKSACKSIFGIMNGIDSQIGARGVDEIDSKRNFIRRHLSDVLSNLTV